MRKIPTKAARLQAGLISFIQVLREAPCQNVFALRCLLVVWIGLIAVARVQSQSNLVLMVSEPGEFLGQGRTTIITNASDFSVGLATDRSPNFLVVFGDRYWLYFHGERDVPFHVGEYECLGGDFPTIRLGIESRSCGDGYGNYQILELETNLNNEITRLWLTFTSRIAPNSPSLSGEVRYHSLLAPPPPEPRVIRVPSDFPTIQAALNDASLLTVDTVLVAPGVYHEAVDFGGKRIRLISEAGASRTFLTRDDSSNMVSFNRGETSESVLCGFTISTWGYGISILQASPTITSNEIVRASTGIYCSASSPTIEENKITGLFFMYGIELNFPGNGTPLIRRNLISRCGVGIKMFQAGSPRIEGNVIRDNWGDAINMVNHSDADIVQNVITGNKRYGIYALVPGGGRGPFIINNTIAENGRAGIGSFGFHARSEIINNIIWGNPCLAVDAYLGESPPLIQFNNLFAPNGSLFEGGVLTNLNQVPVNISGNPQFACPLSGDYRIMAGSPCIDAGSNGVPFLPSVDFGGTPRIVDGDSNSIPQVDMGAFEFNPVVQIESCPTVTGPILINVECGSSVVISLQVSNANGGTLQFGWKVDGMLVQTNLLEIANAASVTNVSLVTTLASGWHSIEATVADGSGVIGTHESEVVVNDTKPPVVISPTNMAVDFTEVSGTPVSFPEVAIDACSGEVKLYCWPFSGSVFPIGTNVIECFAADNLQNSSYSNVLLVVRGGRGMHADVLSELQMVRAAQGRRSTRLDRAVSGLTRSVKSDNWTDEMHLRRGGGESVYRSDVMVVGLLKSLVGKGSGGTEVLLYQKSIDRLTKADRVLASVQLEEAKQGANPKEQQLLLKASNEMTRGDRAATDHSYSLAILRYGSTWRIASSINAQRLRQ